MSKTTRKTRSGLKYKDGRNLNYICRCERCTGIEKERLQNKIRNKELKILLG